MIIIAALLCPRSPTTALQRKFTHVCRPFGAGEVDHEEASEAHLLQDVSAAALLLHGDLQDGVGAGGRLVGGRRLLGALLVAPHQQLHDLKTRAEAFVVCTVRRIVTFSLGMNEESRDSRSGHRSDLLCVDGRHLGDSSDLDHAFRIFPQVQEARGRVQQVPDHLISQMNQLIVPRALSPNTRRELHLHLANEVWSRRQQAGGDAAVPGLPSYLWIISSDKGRDYH
ncbi:hypothetical protein EYF80_048902 [Liparis tanakae]|uniref:Uncharacterized protein n=1 Tax=Liparis tanakae TaxID=230148 RepID=A0A4Z2FJH7_9TELE|nr:hypothetical protein EYF80_048902 [Liparis tanakae]